MSTSVNRRSFAQWLRGALVVALLVTAIGCDSGGGEDDEEDSIDGLWASRGADVFYLDIDTDASEIVIYDFLGDDDAGDVDDCYLSYEAEIIDIDGDTYTLLTENGEQTVRISAEGGVLEIVEGSGAAERFDRSDERASDFRSECELDGESISGLWQFSAVDVFDLDADVFYFDIDAEAEEIVIYDFLGDDFDEGEDCYRVLDVDITDVDGDVYTLRFNYEDGTTETGQTRLRAEGDVLLSTIADAGGNETTERYNRSSESVDEFTPECESDGDGDGDNLRGPRHKSGFDFLR